MTHYHKDDTKFKGQYYLVTVEINGNVTRFDEYYLGRGQDRADAYVAAIQELSGWQIDLKWENVADAVIGKRPKSEVKENK